MSPQVLPTAPGEQGEMQRQQQQAQQQQGGQLEQQQGGQQQQADGAGGRASVLELLDSFQVVQRERAGAYRRFDAAFRALLQNKAEGPYRHVIGELTGQFQELSRRVLALEDALKEEGQDDAAALLRIVQENEREKLRLTLAMHALKSAHAQQRFSWQQEEAAAASLAPGVEDLLQGHLCSIGCMHEAPADEPTQAEYAAAVKETYQLLQGAVVAINEALEEVQQLSADMLEQ